MWNDCLTPTSRWMDKQNAVYTYSGIFFRVKGISCNVEGPWNSTLSERSQSQKTGYCTIPFMWEMSTVGQAIETENTFVFVKDQRGRWGEWRVATDRHQIPFGSDKNVLNLIVVIVTQLCGYSKNQWIVQNEWTAWYMNYNSSCYGGKKTILGSVRIQRI